MSTEISSMDICGAEKAQIWHSYLPGFHAVEFSFRVNCENTDLVFTKDGWTIDTKDPSVIFNRYQIPYEFVKAFITKLSKELSLSSRQNKKLNSFLFREQVYDLHKEKEVKKVPLLERLAVKFLKLKNYNVYKSWSDQ